MWQFKDMTGQRFGRLVVVERAEDYIPPSGSKKIMWRCKCDCGNEAIVMADALRQGRTKSCGCISKEKTAERNETHGLSKTRLYAVWYGMKGRCENPNHTSYARYGGRGIGVCEEWKHFEPFQEWAIAAGYDANAERGQCTIERIDNSLCNFDTTFEQDLERIYTLRDLGYSPYVTLYNKESIPKGHQLRKLQRWCNNRFIFAKCKTFEEYCNG